MYSKAEVAHLRQAFWTTLGQYLAPVPGAEGGPVNWINYRTGLKYVSFRLEADQHQARVAIELTHPDAGVRELFYAQLLELKPLLHAALGEDWTWEPATLDEHGQPLARIGRVLPGVNLFSRDDWPALISFFKPRLIALDQFWSEAQYTFEALRD